MSGLQTIIDKCDSISIDRRNVVGIQYTRNETPRVSVTPTKNPWKIRLTMPNSVRYSEGRALMEAIDTLDRYLPEQVTFSNVSGMSWMFAYQGTMSNSHIANLTVTSYVGNTLTLGNLPPIAGTRVMFEPNDLIQIVGFPYPFTVETQVLRGLDATVTVQTHRPNIMSTSVDGYGIVVGNACEWNFFCPNMPTYKLIPGAPLYSNGVKTNNAVLEWSDNFYLFEYVSAA